MTKDPSRDRFENTLRKGVARVGHFVERLIGKAKEAKVNLEKNRSGIKPLLSLEGRLPLLKIRSLIHLFGERFLIASLPSLEGKSVLELAEKELFFHRILLEKKPKNVYELVVGDFKKTQTPSDFQMLRGNFKSIPFEDRFFDCVIADLATPLQGDVVSTFKEVGRVLALNAYAFILDFHPFGLYAKGGSERLRSPQANIRGFEDYFKMCRLSDLEIEEVREGFMDDTMRNQFLTPEEMNIFREIKGTPFVLFLKVKKKN